MPEWSVSWDLIPDGISTIVKFEVSGEFTVSTAAAAKEAQAGAAKIIARITQRDEAEVLSQLRATEQSQLWFGEGPRPDEPPHSGEATDADH